MADQFRFPLYFSSLSDLLRFNNNEDINISSNIGNDVAVEHYRWQGCKDSRQLLVLAFQKVWPAKLSKGSKPFNVRAKRFYEKALQLQHQPDRFNQFFRVDTADKASTLTFINAIASFPAEPHTEAATSNLPTTAISTVTPQAPLAINVSASPRIRGHSCDFVSSVHTLRRANVPVMPKGNVQVDSNNQTPDTQTVATCCVYLVLGGRKAD